MPKVSIIIPCYNYAEFLEPALSSILCQSYPDWEVIVVDDGSADNSAETAENFFSKFPDRKWKLIRQENAGLPSARNAGIRESSGEFILPLDADDMLHPLYLERTVPVLIKTPGLGYVYVIADCFGDEHRTWTGGEFDFGKLLENNLMTCTTLYRKQAWLDAGGYNPNMKHGFEDWDLWVGMAEKGWFGRLLNEPLFLYRKHGSTMLTETYANHDDWSRSRLILNHPSLYPSDLVEKARFIIEKTAELEAVNKNEHAGSADSILMFHYEKPIDPPGVNAGAEMALIHLGRALAKLGKKVTIAGNLTCEEGVYEGVRYVSTGENYDFSVVLNREASNHNVLLVSARADVIEESLKHRNLKSRLLLLQVDSLSVARIPAERINQICDGIFCVSEAQNGLMVQQGIDPSKVTILYNGADPELFQPKPVPRDPHRIAYAGALVPLKGVHNLINAFIEVKKVYSDAILDIFGSADLWSEAEYLDTSKNDPSVTGIHFHGKIPQPQLAEAFSRASLSVVPSLLQRPDPHPLTAMDAQSCECPVLVTPSGGLPETVEDGVTGKVLPDDTAESIRKYILEMLADPQKLRAMGKAGRKRILKKFTWNNAARIVLNTAQPVKPLSSETQTRRAPANSSDNLRTGIISTFNQKCGLATYMAFLLEHYPPESTTIFAEDTADDRIGTDGANVLRCWKRESDDYGDLENAIGKSKIDILHINFQPAFFKKKSFYEMLVRLRNIGVKVVASLHVLEQENSQNVNLARTVDAALFHLPYTKLQWAQFGGNPNSTYIVPHGIPRIPTRPRNEIRQSLGIPDGHQLYVSFGFVEPHKGVLENIYALLNLKGIIPFTYVILGDAHPRNPAGREYIEKCQSVMQQLGLENEIQFMTEFHPEEQIYVMLKAADAIIMNYISNRYESSGATALALSSGNPVVTSNSPSFSDLGSTVIRVTECNTLAKILIDLRQKPHLRKFLQQNSNRIADERSWANTARKIRGIYTEILKN